MARVPQDQFVTELRRLCGDEVVDGLLESAETSTEGAAAAL